MYIAFQSMLSHTLKGNFHMKQKQNPDAWFVAMQLYNFFKEVYFYNQGFKKSEDCPSLHIRLVNVLVLLIILSHGLLYCLHVVKGTIIT